VKTESEDAQQFRAEVIRWQGVFGLTDWIIHIKVQKATPDEQHEAETSFDCETRYATVVYNLGVEDAMHPSDVAYHEICHLLLADLIFVALHVRGIDGEADKALGIEEHKAIMRLHAARGVK
jgi:hypothetical protein